MSGSLYWEIGGRPNYFGYIVSVVGTDSALGRRCAWVSLPGDGNDALHVTRNGNIIQLV